MCMEPSRMTPVFPVHGEVGPVVILDGFAIWVLSNGGSSTEKRRKGVVFNENAGFGTRTWFWHHLSGAFAQSLDGSYPERLPTVWAEGWPPHVDMRSRLEGSPMSTPAAPARSTETGTRET